jgi:hypothetical protein
MSSSEDGQLPSARLRTTLGLACCGGDRRLLPRSMAAGVHGLQAEGCHRCVVLMRIQTTYKQLQQSSVNAVWGFGGEKLVNLKISLSSEINLVKERLYRKHV